jgi:hypothetical protein
MYCKVYFILVHKNSKQLAELIDLLHDDCSLFFVHVDKKVDLHLFDANGGHIVWYKPH